MDTMIRELAARSQTYRVPAPDSLSRLPGRYAEIDASSEKKEDYQYLAVVDRSHHFGYILEHFLDMMRKAEDPDAGKRCIRFSDDQHLPSLLQRSRKHVQPRRPPVAVTSLEHIE